MKKIVILSLLILSIGCKKDDTNDTFISNINHQIKITYGTFFDNKPAEDVLIKFTNLQSGTSYHTKTDSKGEAEIELPAGVYEINASKTLSATEMRVLSGEEKEANFNASVTKKSITSQNNEPTLLELSTGRVGNLLIKQVYYLGSDTKQGANDRDLFFEIHNNSNETLFLDKLCFAQIYGVRMIEEDKGQLLPNKQYDWSKSPSLIGLGDKANTDYVYAYEVIAFPGTGNEYPLASGKSILVARTAQNHKQPLTIGNKKYEVPNPELTVNLSGAKFEVFYPNHQQSNAGIDTDIDNPNATNMLLIYKVNTYKDLTLNSQGRDAYVLFYLPEDLNQWKKAQSPEPVKKGRTPRLYLQIPNQQIIDGVNLQDIATKLPHRLPSSIDAGEILSTKGPNTSQSAIRKIKKQVDGKFFYQDTNNSTRDFELIDRPNVLSLNE
ncbi:DUF4876 domain-containing protein [Capnocytophaga canimorsus]|uniref:DUF4876 domain-containing protein n=1 Tax=Capnocytophaga canimorsus TaxID=28188 RepID=UPI0037D88DCB